MISNSALFGMRFLPCQFWFFFFVFKCPERILISAAVESFEEPVKHNSTQIRMHFFLNNADWKILVSMMFEASPMRVRPTRRLKDLFQPSARGDLLPWWMAADVGRFVEGRGTGSHCYTGQGEVSRLFASSHELAIFLPWIALKNSRHFENYYNNSDTTTRTRFSSALMYTRMRRTRPGTLFRYCVHCLAFCVPTQCTSTR